MALRHVSWITIDECINSYLNESEQSNHKYAKLWHLAFDGMNQMGLDAFYTVKSVKILTNANLTVTLPPDCLKISKVGVFNQQGQVIPLSVNNNLSTAYDMQPTRLSQTVDNTINTYNNIQNNIWYNYWNGNSLGTLYGAPSGAPFVGSYKIDNANNVIVLSEHFIYPYVVLEYVSSPDPSSECEYYVPIQFKEAMVAYLRWKDIISIPAKTHVQNSNVAQRRRDYFNEYRLAKARYDPINMNDLYQWNLNNQRLAIKA